MQQVLQLKKKLLAENCTLIQSEPGYRCEKFQYILGVFAGFSNTCTGLVNTVCNIEEGVDVTFLSFKISTAHQKDLYNPVFLWQILWERYVMEGQI